MRRTHKYANASQVKCYSDGGKVKKKKQVVKGNKKTAKPDMLGSGAAAKAGEALQNTRKKQMEELGLKDGGAVKMKPPQKGGKPKKITTSAPPGGRQTPGAKGTYPRKKMACGGKVRKR